MDKVLERLKVLIDSSTPIVVMETVEESRAVRQDAAAARGFSGAEIESVVQTALYAAYSQKQQLTDQHLLDAIRATVPLSTPRAEQIQQLPAWAAQWAVQASLPEAKAEGM
ncbi:MAG TPA: hypothetical protein VK466_05615 [Terriglobales bacterium]|nr:hypothetical protein [Terriglobales bacterium]